MPVLNARGDVLAGGGGRLGSRNGVPYPFASDGGGQWLTADVILVQLHPQSVLATWTPGAAPQPLTPLRGSTGFVANAGKFLANLGPTMYGALGDHPNAACIGIADDGTCAFYPNSGSGIGLTIVDPNGLVHEYPSVIAKPSPQVVSAGYVIWDGGAVGGPPCRPALPSPLNGTRLVTYQGARWLLYWAPSLGIILQPDGADQGWLLETGDAFNRAIRVVGDALVVTWSTTASEAPDEVVVLSINRDGVRPVRGPYTVKPVWMRLVAPVPAPVPVPVPIPAPPRPSPEPIPVPETPFDPSAVQFIDSPSCADWPQTATIRSVRFDGDRFQVDHSGRETWPDLPFGDGSDGKIQYTLGICAFVGGQWRGSAVVQFWKDRELAAGGSVSGFAADWFYSERWGALYRYQPKPGERVAVYALAGNDRDNSNPPTGANRQRTDFALVTWGQSYQALGPHPLPPDPPEPSPVPSPDPGLADLQREIDAITARLQVLEAGSGSGPTRGAIKSSRGKYLRDDWGDSLAHFDRDSASDGETYTWEPKS